MAGVNRREAARNLTRIVVYENPAEALPAWRELEAIAPTSAYQTYKWLAPWIETIGRPRGVCPMIVVCHGANDLPVALFPFGIVQQGNIRLVNFLGGRDSNLNLGLIRPHVQLNQSDVESLLRIAADNARLKPDAFVLVNQPRSWEGVPNPLAQLPHQRSPSQLHSATLGPNGADFVNERLSGDARRKLRSKRKKLSEMGRGFAHCGEELRTTLPASSMLSSRKSSNAFGRRTFPAILTRLKRANFLCALASTVLQPAIQPSSCTRLCRAAGSLPSMQARRIAVASTR